MADEAGNYRSITGLEVDHWLWLGSIVAAVIGCVVATTRRREDQGAGGNHGVSAGGQ